MKLKINIPPSFFKEREVTYNKNGDKYTTSTEMKKVWAVQIDLLKEFERVCNKYNIKYFASGGTLLGSVRHKGYIPWDDDIDVRMMRDEYEKLLTHKDEFQEPYFLQTPYTDENGFFDSCVKLRNSNTTGCMPQDLHLKINNGIFMDILVLDCVPDDEKKRKKFLRKVLRKGIFGLYSSYYVRKFFAYIFKRDRKITKNYISKMQKKYKKFVKFCTKYNNLGQKSCTTVTFVNPDLSYPLIPVSAFEEQQFVPFEFTTISIPKNDTDAILKALYGENYMTPLRLSSMHGKLYLDAEMPYKDFIKEKKYKNYKFLNY